MIPLLAACVLTSVFAGVRIEPIPGQAEVGTVEIHGLAASEFDQKLWESGELHFVPDVRSPLLSPRLSGVFRNIYAPSPVEVPGGWRVFYGAWDGVPTGNDRIYSVRTADFLDFAERRTEIEHGQFIHVCNVNAHRLADGSYRLMCTAYPDANKLNKPAFFTSPDGNVWNGTPAPHPATAGDLISMEGYAPYKEADINGINVLLPEGDAYHLYFGNFTAHGHVHRATSRDGRQYVYEGVCLDTPHMVNDVRTFRQGDRTVYLMALHANTDKLWYSLSSDGMKFGPERPLGANQSAADKYIVAVGWVTRDRNLLGFLYGAGAVPSLDRNRIFARWLQKKLVFTPDAGGAMEAAGALGPDRQVFSLRGKSELTGRLQAYREDGKTPLGEPRAIKLVSGAVYRVVWDGKP